MIDEWVKPSLYYITDYYSFDLSNEPKFRV